MSDFAKSIFIVIFSYIAASCGFIIADFVLWFKAHSDWHYNFSVGTGTLLLGFGAIYTIADGLKRYKKFILQSERSEEERKLRFETASKSIDLSYKIAAAMKDIRYIISDYQSLKVLAPSCLPSISSLYQRAHFSTPQEVAEVKSSRMVKFEPLFAELRAIILKYRIIIGNADNLIFLRDVFYEKFHLSIIVLSKSKEWNKESKEHLKELNDYGFLCPDKADELSSKIEAAVKDIEETCAPIINSALHQL